MKKIREYLDSAMEGDATLNERLEVFETHKKVVMEKIAELEKYMRKIDFKILYYKTAIEHGTEAVHAQADCGFEDLE